MGQRHKKKRGQMGTGKPDPSKDRSAHEAARGRKKVSLQDLTRELPSDEHLTHYITLVRAESDRGAAIMPAAIVERALEDNIRAHLVDPIGELADAWFEGVNAPFKSFASKIALGRAMGLYTDQIHDYLTVVKNIRNTFAHRMIPLSFSHPTVAAECKKLEPTTFEIKMGPRDTYVGSCLSLARILGMARLGSFHLGDVPTTTERGNQ